MPPHLKRSAPAAACAVAIVAAVAWVLPSGERQPLVETSIWALLVLTAFAGYGSAIRFIVAPRAEVDLGLRTAWGAGAVCFLGGLLHLPALMTRTAAIVLVEAGVILALGSLALERATVARRFRFTWRFVKREPLLAAVIAFVVLLVIVQCLAGIADWHTNPYDDDIAYLAFAKKLSDTGTVIEPFSFRRLSAYGGQTLFIAILGVRAAMAQANVFDRGVCFVIIVLLLTGYRSPKGRRRPALVLTIATVTMLVTLPSIAINTASYFSGVVFFLGLFRTLVWLERRDLAPARAAIPIALLGAAACTLRQNYLPIPAFVLAVSYLTQFRRTTGQPLLNRLAEPLFAAAFSIVCLVPWFIVSWQSNRTFLYPLMPGDFHQPLALNASAWNFVREVAFHIANAIDTIPLQVLGLFVLAAAFMRERSARSPLLATTIGTAGGFALLVHGLTQSDPQNIGRYAFGFLMALALATMLATSTVRLRFPFDRAHVAAALVAIALLVQLVFSREKMGRDYMLKFHNIEELAYAAPRHDRTQPPEVGLYYRLQDSVPAGERLAVLVDQPLFLDFARNPIWNLDMPGYASLDPGMPSFKGSVALEHYLRGLGLRWLMFVQPEYSRYHYRREYFLELFVHEQEIWRAYSPYLIDFIDSLVEIKSRHRVAFAERGIVVLDLAQGAP